MRTENRKERESSAGHTDNSLLGLLDREFGRKFDRPRDGFDPGRIVAANRDGRPLAFGLSCSRGFAVSSMIDEDRLRQAVSAYEPEELELQPVCDYLMGLLPKRPQPWRPRKETADGRKCEFCLVLRFL